MDGKEFEELRELVEFLKNSGIAEFQMERPDMKVALKFICDVPATPAGAATGVDLSQLAQLLAAQRAPESVAALPIAPMPAVPAAAAAPAAEPVAADPTAGAHVVKSPIVGTFYDAPSPEAEPFVRVGDRVKTGQVLCIVEAMKLMNEIESDVDGEVVKVLGKPGQPVEYGQPLFAVKA